MVPINPVYGPGIVAGYRSSSLETFSILNRRFQHATGVRCRLSAFSLSRGLQRAEVWVDLFYLKPNRPHRAEMRPHETQPQQPPHRHGFALEPD